LPGGLAVSGPALNCQPPAPRSRAEEGSRASALFVTNNLLEDQTLLAVKELLGVLLSEFLKITYGAREVFRRLAPFHGSTVAGGAVFDKPCYFPASSLQPLLTIQKVSVHVRHLTSPLR